tara:strand:- start:277 stop:432 length:156 start_codon:yes stop_codon:yes gene_type:complete
MPLSGVKGNLQSIDLESLCAFGEVFTQMKPDSIRLPFSAEELYGKMHYSKF